MLKEKSEIKNYYYPCCKETGCNGFLKIKYGDNFTIDYECEKNSSHKRKNIYFKVFERFYLKKEEIKKCSKCLYNLDNFPFICQICNNFYCFSCSFHDAHIKKDINNLKPDSKICFLHNSNLTLYCKDCKQYFCFYCYKNKENSHNFVNLHELMLSKYESNKINYEIYQKFKFYAKIIDSINQWESYILYESNQLKQYLRNEISLLEKLFLNYNQFFLNYSYLSLFKNFDDFKSKYHEKLIEFDKCFKIEEQTKILFEIFDMNKKKEANIIQKKWNFRNFSSIKDGIIEKINNDYYFLSDNKRIYLIKDEKEEDKIIAFTEFDKKIYSVSISPKKNRIYACLENERIVQIFNYNLTTQELNINNNEIKDRNYLPLNFNKCIDVGHDYLATADYLYINIWTEKNGNFSKLKKFLIFNKTSDLLKADNDYFISLQPNNKTITIFDIKK